MLLGLWETNFYKDFFVNFLNFLKDIASPEIRGSLGAIPSVAGALGVVSFQVKSVNQSIDFKSHDKDGRTDFFLENSQNKYKNILETKK